jgi:hypothetical protein
LRDLTNQKERQMQIKRALFLPKKAATLNWFVLAIQICRLKKINREEEKTFGLDTIAIRQKTNFQPDTGLVKHGEDRMEVKEVLAKLEKHEAECNLRYKRIEERMEDHKSSLKTLDVKLWALAILILIAPFVQKMWE